MCDVHQCVCVCVRVCVRVYHSYTYHALPESGRVVCVENGRAFVFAALSSRSKDEKKTGEKKKK